MAVTAMVANSNRHLSDYSLQGAVATVALDATVSEAFTLPTTFGALMLKSVIVLLNTLSGAYAAPTPPFDGPLVYVVSADGATWVDNIGVSRFVHSLTSSTRPGLSASFDLQNHVLIRRDERIIVSLPILGGGGVTGSVNIVIRGTRFSTA